MGMTVELRCPMNPSRLFAKMRSGDARIDPASNLIEVACVDCRKQEPGAWRVLHRFDATGELVETEVVKR